MGKNAASSEQVKSWHSVLAVEAVVCVRLLEMQSNYCLILLLKSEGKNPNITKQYFFVDELAKK